MKEKPKTDIETRFSQELRAQDLPEKVMLKGNGMLVQIAARLLKNHAPHIIIAADGKPVQLLSMEMFGAAVLAHFLEEKELPAYPLLLHTIPEEELVAFARRHSIAIVQDEPDDVRKMLDNIASQQPQTYFSLCKSAQRLLALRERRGK